MQCLALLIPQIQNVVDIITTFACERHAYGMHISHLLDAVTRKASSNHDVIKFPLKDALRYAISLTCHEG